MSTAPAMADSPASLTLADLARRLGTETTIPVFHLVEPTEAELAAIALPDDDLVPTDEKVAL